ncbi:MAG: DUF1963 domain-containing protein [Pseudomonadota bacterium]
MRLILLPLSFLSPPALIAATLMLAVGVKGDPMNLELAAWGVVLLILAGLTFPRPDHPLSRYFKRRQARAQEKRAQSAHATQAMDTLQQIIEVNEEAAQFEAKAQPHHAGWSRLDIQVGQTDTASSWVGGLPEMPEDMAWPETDGKAAMFLAQIALSDLPDTIWGGLGPKTGWLLFFLAPRDLGGATVLHITQKGAPRPYPDNACTEFFASSDTRAALRADGQPESAFRPRKWAVTVSAAQDNPPGIFERLTERDALWDAYRDIDLTDPRLAEVARGPDASHFLANMRALDIYQDNPNRLSAETRALFEDRWAAEAEWQGSTMSGPVSPEFWYTAPKNPVSLLRLSSSDLVGWDFHDVAPMGIFISPRDLKRGRWHKAWYDIAN